MKLVSLIKMCFNKTYSKVPIGKHLSDNFRIQNGLKQGDVLSPLLFNFALGYTIRKVQENQVALKSYGTYQLLVYPDDMNLLEDNIVFSVFTSRPISLLASVKVSVFFFMASKYIVGCRPIPMQRLQNKQLYNSRCYVMALSTTATAK
jgi:hypothetical protein